MFKNKRLITWCLFIIIAVAAGCKSKFEKLQQSNDTAKKYQEAIRLYNNKSYSKALILFDDLIQRYRGRAEAEDLSYYFAYTNYKLRDYTTARYQFKVFADTYPNSQKAEECRFMSAYCYYLESPNFTLDQENTIRAIESMQLFINLYPKSERVAEASKLIQNLRDKLESKAFANAKLYLTTGPYDAQNYRAAVIAFRNVLRDYPDTKYAEEIGYLTIKAQNLFSINSLETKQEERYNESIVMANEFLEDFPASKYVKDVQNLKEEAEQGIARAQKALALAQPKAKTTDTKQEDKKTENE
ncbi:outer membrane protein assembly factor BamD [Desertivirga xinjiangensis]|uniref:outer membrane protein assembly factor BamD n=1 Tax=Desertivirga xinjiangensis TaxID=539206 RepID=UPI0021097E66|nr:outer membrane protein assembly factor BamD [Pedobacter xinjiangensis]